MWRKQCRSTASLCLDAGGDVLGDVALANSEGSDVKWCDVSDDAVLPTFALALELKYALV